MRLALYQPDMAPNVGAAIRLAACFGVPLDIIEPCGFALTSRDIKRVAMDYGKLAQVERHVSWDKFLSDDLIANGRIVLMTTRAAIALWEHQFEPGDIVLMGRESAGVPDEVHARADHRLMIPMAPSARSFNLVVSAGIVLAEASRQLGLDGIANGIQQG